MKKIFIFYFSGTGNSKNVAKWLKEFADTRNIECNVYDITKLDNTAIKDILPEDTIIFISPIHGFNYPPVFINFLLRFTRGKNNIYLINTRAGMLIKNFITPGLSGIAFYLAIIILAFKGYTIKGFMPVNLPSNWISIHPGLNDRTVDFLHSENKKRLTPFFNSIIENKYYLKYLREILQDLLAAPIAVPYYLVGRFMLSKTYFASANCNNCMACINNCPVNAIKLVNNRPFWTYKCESCMRCLGNCPHKAINVNHGYTLIINVIFGIIITPILYYLSSLNIPLKGIWFSIARPLIFIGFTFSAYRFMHYLLPISIVEKIITFTSLTKYKFWGKKYKAINKY